MSVHQRVYNAFVQNKTTQEKLKAISSSSIANRNMIDGGFGSVTKMVLRNGNRNIEYVIKTVANINKTDKFDSYLINYSKYKYSKHSEYDYLRIMDHPNIIKVYDVFDYKSNDAQKKLSNVLCIVSEFGGKTLDKYIQTSDPTVYQKSHIFMKICSAIAYISNLGLQHRDLKPNNITVKENEPKIIDFGLMIFKNNDDNGIGTSGWTRGYYFHHELIGLNKDRGRTDNFALGVLLWYIFTQKMPKKEFYMSLQEKDLLDICRQSLKKDEYLNTNDKKETFKVIIDLVIDLIHKKEKLFEIENLKLFCKQFISFNNDTMYNKYKELSIAPPEKVTEISELRKKMVNATTKIQAVTRGIINRKKVAAVKKAAANKAIVNKSAANRTAAVALINRFVNRKNKNQTNFKGKLNTTLGCQEPECDSTFGIFTRQHHCKICLNPFCSQHVTKRNVIILRDVLKTRVQNKLICDPCFAKYTNMGIIIGGKKKIIKSTKKVRKHQGIYQRGPKKCKLKPGFKYSGKKTKTGLKIIVKVKKPTK